MFARVHPNTHRNGFTISKGFQWALSFPTLCGIVVSMVIQWVRCPFFDYWSIGFYSYMRNQYAYSPSTKLEAEAGKPVLEPELNPVV